MRKNISVLVISIVLAVAATAANAAEKVTYLFPAPDFLPAFSPFQLARHKGYYEDAGLDVTFQVGKGGADVAKQVAVGNADLGGGIGDTPIIVRANGLEVRSVAILGGRSLTQIATRKDAGIATMADLKGKSVGVLSFKDTTYYNLLAVIANAGLSKDDVDIQAVGPGGIIKLMISGDLHAFSGVPEWTGAIKGAGIDVDVTPIDDIFPAMAQAILASDDTIAKRPEVVQGFVSATLKALNDVISDPAQASQDYVAAVPQHEGKEKIMEGIMRKYIELVYATAEGTTVGTADESRIKAVQDFYVSNNIVREAVPVADTFTNQFVK